MANAPTAPLRKRYGKARSRLTAQDKADLELAREGARQVLEHPESALTYDEFKHRFGIK